METENNYGLSEGVFKACEFLGLKFPAEIKSTGEEHLPSDYFGDDFELDSATKKKLCAECGLSSAAFNRRYTSFSKAYLKQKPLRRNKTNLNIYFCDFLLSKRKYLLINHYLNLEFYKKSSALQNTFVVADSRIQIQLLFNNGVSRDDKTKEYKIFSDFLHRDWLDLRQADFGAFKNFAEKHPHFVSKIIDSNQGSSVEVIDIAKDKNLEKLFDRLKAENRVIEEMLRQHESLNSFCADTLNTIRIYTVLDIHDIVHIIAATGKFGRKGQFIDNFHVGGMAATINLKNGVVTSNAINRFHERLKNHPDTGKQFKGFQYPCWEEVLSTVRKMAKMIPQFRHIGWDIAINEKSEVVLVEANSWWPGMNLLQAPDDTGRLYLYAPLLEEMKNYKIQEMKLLGYRVNNIPNFDSSYANPSRQENRLKTAVDKLIPNCASVLDLGCRQNKLAKKFCPANVRYYPVDYIKYDDEVYICDFIGGEGNIFPNIEADTVLCAFTAEYVEQLPQFLANMCTAAQKQILMICRPMSETEIVSNYRWSHPFLVDFTEEFLVDTMTQNNFKLIERYPFPENNAVVLYDFRKILAEQMFTVDCTQGSVNIKSFTKTTVMT